jgi:tetratricopeptide (TPR) repeat protein
MRDDALERLRAELEAATPDVWRRVLIAVLEDRQDEASFEAAKQAFDAALAEGEDAGLLYEYGYIHECRARGSVREAIRWYERSLELDPTFEKAHHQLIAAYGALGQAHDAIALYERRLAAAPEAVVEHRLLAHAYLAAGKHEQAGTVVEAGLALLPDDPQLLLQQGTVFEAGGRPEEALAAWGRAFELDPEFIDARYSRVFLLERLRRLEDAAAEWEAIIEWLLERGFEVEAEWPKRELARVRAQRS